MNFYLAMSPERLLVTLVFGYILLTLYFVLISKLSTRIKYTPSHSSKIISYAVFTVIILYTAINVGQRQEDLNRSSFNSSNSEVLEKKEVSREDSQAVKSVKTQFKEINFN